MAQRTLTSPQNNDYRLHGTVVISKHASTNCIKHRIPAPRKTRLQRNPLAQSPNEQTSQNIGSPVHPSFRSPAKRQLPRRRCWQSGSHLAGPGHQTSLEKINPQPARPRIVIDTYIGTENWPALKQRLCLSCRPKRPQTALCSSHRPQFAIATSQLAHHQQTVFRSSRP